MNTSFFDYLKSSGDTILSYYQNTPFFPMEPSELYEGTFVYFERGGKRLRPAICRLAAGICGGDEAEQAATPCALALELYHNWTLVHDDMIDHDDLRRGQKAVHKLVQDRFAESYGDDIAREYGYDNALLAGDALHSASIYYLSRLSDSGSVPPAVTLQIISLLEGEYGPRLISGEAVDTRGGLFSCRGGFASVTKEQVLSMMAGKTGALFGISALSGALIGLKSTRREHPYAQALALFAESCGIAFQLQDDILGITSTREELGKPIGGDVREGKPTLLLLTSYENASPAEKEFLLQTVGVSRDDDAIREAMELLRRRGGIEATQKLALEYLSRAEEALAVLPDSPRKALLDAWREFMLNRSF